ncbi:DUF2924 domain-containing protein [Planctomycetota bacterium]
MSVNVKKTLSRLERMTVGELREQHERVFGEETGTHNRKYLLKRLAWRIRDIYVFHRNGPRETGTGLEFRKMISGNTQHIRRSI